MFAIKSLTIFIIIIVLGLYKTTLIHSNDFAFKWRIGEELTYKMKWSFIRLGTPKLEIADTSTVEDEFIYHIKLYIDSNPTLFFVNMHNVYNSFINENIQLHHFYAE